MARVRPYLIFIVLLALVFGLAVLSPGQPQGAPDHNSESDAPDGTSALFAFAAALGHPVETLRSDGLPGAARAALFVFTPTTPFTDDQAGALVAWVRGGGTLVYATEFDDPALDRALAIHRIQVGAPDSDYYAVPGLFAGVRRLARPAGFEVVNQFRTTPDQVAALTAHYGDVGVTVGLERRLGAGRVVVLGDPCILCNGALGSGDNGAFAADLLSLAPGDAPVAVDEFHHGAVGGGGATDWVTTPWGAVIAWILVLGYGGFLLRGRAFGPPIPIRRPGERSPAEYARAVGGLLRRTGGRGVTMAVVEEATHRALAERLGLGHGAPRDVLGNVLRRRAPALGAELERAEAAAAGATSEHALLDAARRLHTLAYPSPVRHRLGDR